MKTKFFILLSLFMFMIPQPVSAYLDPGFGSMVWQMIAAGAFAAIFTVKIYWKKLKNFLFRTLNERG